MAIQLHIVSYPHAYCYKCKAFLECVQYKDRAVKGIECPLCKEFKPVTSHGKAPLKGFTIGLALYMEQ